MRGGEVFKKLENTDKTWMTCKCWEREEKGFMVRSHGGNQKQAQMSRY